MKSLNRFLLVGAAALPFLFTACSTSDYTPSPDVEKYQHEIKNVILDDNLTNDMKVEYVRHWHTETGIENISIRGRFRTTGFIEWVFDSYENTTIAYRFAWYDDKGVEIQTTPQIWLTLNVEPGEEVGFTSTAPSKEAKDFKLFIKRLTKQDKDSFEKAQPEVKPEEGVLTKAENEEKAEKTGKATVAKDVKIAPSTPNQATPTGVKDTTGPQVEEKITTPPSTPNQNAPVSAGDEAAADAASVRQATPAKPAAATKK